MAFTIDDFLDHFNSYKVFKPPFNKLGLEFKLYGTYYNQMSQAFEPFIEPWSLDISIV